MLSCNSSIQPLTGEIDRADISTGRGTGMQMRRVEALAGSQREGSRHQPVLQVAAGWCFSWRPPAWPLGAPPCFDSFVALRDPWGFQAHSCLVIHKLAARGRLMTQLRGVYPLTFYCGMKPNGNTTIAQLQHPLLLLLLLLLLIII